MITGIPETLIHDLNRIPRDRPVALLMRHSARFPILDPALTFEIGLTEEGVRTAEALGGIIKDQFQPGRLMAAPVGRCLDTAAAIARGAGWVEAVRSDERLSHPFMIPAWEVLEQAQFKGVLPAQIRITLDLLLYAPELAPFEDNPRLDLMVTHDTVLGAVVGGLLHIPFSSANWPEFLEGAFIWKTADQVHARWRGVETVMNWQRSPSSKLS